jgi:hypothetical protein
VRVTKVGAIAARGRTGANRCELTFNGRGVWNIVWVARGVADGECDAEKKVIIIGAHSPGYHWNDWDV